MSRRVAIVSPYALSVPGGAQTQVLAMSRELARRGSEVLVVAPDAGDHSDHDTPARVATFGSRVAVPVNGSRAPITLSWFASVAARRAIDTFNPDVVHVHEPVAPLLGYATLHRHAHPTVGTFHRSGGGASYAVARPLLRHLVRGLDASVAVSEAAASTIRREVGVEPTVLFNGFETTRLRSTPRTPTTPPTVLFVGRFEPRKGADTVVAAAALGAGRWHTVLMGDGPERSTLTAMAGEGVTFLGALDDTAKREWLRRADVVVCASRSGESFGVVVVDAMAAEARAVVSDIEGYREAAGDAAVMFPPGDATALAAAISRALVRDVAAIAHARDRAEAWSMTSLMDHYEVIYEDAARSFARRA